jgi:uncharacterized membrane protein (UPF0136 family)
MLGLMAGVSFGAFALMAGPLMVRLSTTGLVLANSVAMILRIAYSVHFIRHRLKGDLTPALAPNLAVLGAFVASFAITFASDARTDVNSLVTVAIHIGIGIVCFIVVAATVWVCERPFLRDLNDFRMMARRGDSGDQSGRSDVHEDNKKKD